MIKQLIVDLCLFVCLQAFKGKLKVRHVVIEQALEQGHNFLLKHEAQSLNYSSNNDDNLAARVAGNLQKQLAHVESQWRELMENSNKWQQTIDVILEVCTLINVFALLESTRCCLMSSFIFCLLQLKLTSELKKYL